MKRFIKATAFIFAGVLTAGLAMGAMKEKPTHLNSGKNVLGCSGCHSSRGAPSGKALCFRCHGALNRKWAKTDIEGLFAKRSKHPVYETEKYHSRGEELPEKLPSVQRHVSCRDCHSAHLTTTDVPWAGSRGYSRGKARLNKASVEYEVCYLCHSDSENLPSGSENMREAFDPANASYHPVEMIGRNNFVPSLVRDLTVNSKVTCTDCHGNSDQNGPKGPHGSDYEPMLVAEYRTFESVESPKAYELCYMCHDRRSVLGDESFPKHRLHVVTQTTSCHTCHTAHGQRDNRHLISFDPAVVGISNTGLGPQYLPGSPTRCYLRCHDIDHNPGGVFRLDGSKPAGSW